jgi:hypothetical protein
MSEYRPKFRTGFLINRPFLNQQLFESIISSLMNRGHPVPGLHADFV